MDVILTDWAVQSYLDLRDKAVFTRSEYKNTIRPDAELLKIFPNDTKFENSRFWGPATEKHGAMIHCCFKMKWHNIGPGKIQLRLLVILFQNIAFLCNSYVKSDDKKDNRMMAKIKNKFNIIAQDKYKHRGLL